MNYSQVANLPSGKPETRPLDLVGLPVGETRHHGDEPQLTLEMFLLSANEYWMDLSPAVSTGRHALAARCYDQVVNMELKGSSQGHPVELVDHNKEKRREPKHPTLP